MNPAYDSALLAILQHEGKIEKFLDVIFGFLMRRTDFYHIMTVEQKKLGFPPGVNLRMVLQVSCCIKYLLGVCDYKAFERYKSMFEEYNRQHMEAVAEKVQSTKSKKQAISRRPPTVDRKTTETASADNFVVPVPDSTQETTAATEEKHSPGDSKPTEQTSTRESTEEEGPLVYQADPDCYNGAERENYTWSQSIKDVDIKVKVPNRIKTGRDLKIAIDRKHIRIVLVPSGNEEPYFYRELCWEISTDDAVWTFDPEEGQVQFCLDKVEERWWDAAFEGEDKINTRKIDCSRPMHELDEESQAKIHQLMYDQECKRKGLPTSEEKKVHDILAKAWDVEGSPFRGTPFDPSKINVGPSSQS
ncbi:CS domain protein [Opisthorchis viverrini]|uniref:CS domain protein n=1 Tax=Opisthorchis viverrini TaxID=6198 RepID=A0A1S8XAN8_OPIVI|nr:CS domain protein [Opisthorchis viverrini]